ncbi:MAG: hypothetical protein ACRD2L_12305 [Terriglobia bacterium]
MAVIVNPEGTTYELHSYKSEEQFEQDVVRNAEHIFGPSSVYIDVKKRVSGNNIVTIPDGYVIDLADPREPKLFVVENEIVEHDAFRHIGIQILKFVTSFESSQRAVRDFLMGALSQDKVKMAKLEQAVIESGSRNVDNYLDKAVYGEFRGLVVIDEARQELHEVLRRIDANISVLEFKSYRSADGKVLYEADTLYDEFEESNPTETSARRLDPTRIARRRLRLAKADTIVVPAREDGFREVFLGQNQWYAIRIGAAMKERLRYIAAYQVLPVSAVTHLAEIDEIKPYKDTGKYRVTFKSAAQPIGPIRPRESKYSPMGPIYVRKEVLLRSKTLEDALTEE